MAKVFLDANVFIDLIEKRKEINLNEFLNHSLFISPLSIHLLTYLYKYKIPAEKLVSTLHKSFSLILFSDDITLASLKGPTSDFEDNVQLHSSVEGECDYFLTSDRALLKLGLFGKTRIVTKLL